VLESAHEGRTELVGADGVDLFVRRFGSPALPVLIVVHGGPTWDHSYLLPAVAGLSDLAHVVLFDLRGCGRSSRTPPVGGLPTSTLQPDLLADDVAALIRHYGADYQARAPLCPSIAWNDPVLTGPDAPDGALSRAMAYAGAPFDIWRLDRLDDWHRVLAAVRFSSDWNAPHTAGQLRPAMPDNAESLLKQWAKPVLILQGSREMSFPVSLARKLHAALPASTLAEIPEAAHMAHFDNSQAWLAAIHGFLSSAQ
jgi:pimeloyl-ACP methyl ester carboxylesterase